MSMEDGPILHPLTPDILSAVVSAPFSAPFWAASSAAEAEEGGAFDALLVNFACGWVTDDERKTVIAALAESEAHRLRLLEMRDRLKSAASTLRPVDDPVLANALAANVRALMQTYLHWKDVCSRVLTAGPSRLDESRSVRSAIRRIDAGWKLQPVGLATTRGETAVRAVSIQTVPVLPGSTLAQLSFAIDPIDGAVVKAELSSPFEPAKELALYVVGPDGEWIFVGAANTEGSQWKLSASRIAEVMGAPASDLRPAWLALTEGSALPTRNAVRLERTTGGVDTSIWLTTTKAPAILAEEFSIGIDLPEAVRADLGAGSIVASVDLGSFRYPFGRWDIRALPVPRQVVLRCPLEGVADGDIELQSAIRLSFVAADPHE